MKQTVCDRCGEVMGEWSHVVHANPTFLVVGDQPSYDLCAACGRELAEWIRSTKPELRPTAWIIKHEPAPKRRWWQG